MGVWRGALAEASAGTGDRGNFFTDILNADHTVLVDETVSRRKRPLTYDEIQGERASQWMKRTSHEN